MTMSLVDLATSVLYCSQPDNVTEKMSSKTFARAQSSGVSLKERSRVKLRRLTQEHISKNIPKSS